MPADLREVFGSLARALTAPDHSSEDLEGVPPFVIPFHGKVTTWRTVSGGKQARIAFPNGYEASIISHSFSYGGDKGLWELAVTDGKRCVYDTPITDDVIGHQTEADINVLLDRIAALPKRG